MTIAIMQPYFFPYIGYWQLINAVDTFVILDDVNYIKRGWINRNRVIVDDQIKYINIPVTDASQNRRINEHIIFDDERNKQRILKMVDISYRKAPYFEDVYQLWQRCIHCMEGNLSQYLFYTIREVCEYLGINRNIIFSSDINKNNELTGQDRIIDICRIQKADRYINPIGGKKLYSEKDFTSNGIALKFLSSQNVTYNQFKDIFVPNLSIIDVMMFNSKADLKKMLEMYELVCGDLP